jgi:DNA-binding CsgD family transcriptional regulator
VKTISPLKINAVSAVEPNGTPTRQKEAPSRLAAGFLLMDTSLNPISVNAEAVQILSFPDNLANLRRPGVFLAGRIRSLLINRQSSSESPFVTEFRSGRRRYFCRAFLVGSNTKKPSRPSLAVLLERGPSEVIPLSQVSEQFNLTQREREALGHLLQGLGGKEIANRMNISPNTVKAYLRLIMTKMGVCSRSAIFGKVLMSAQLNVRSAGFNHDSYEAENCR